jgi:hypothetical protein
MAVSPPLTEVGDATVSTVEIPQYRLLTILAIWAAAALPMAALAWFAAPAFEDHLGGAGDVPMFKALVICLTAGLIWQFVLVVALVWREQRTLRWPIVREALWLRSPRDPKERPSRPQGVADPDSVDRALRHRVDHPDASTR